MATGDSTTDLDVEILDSMAELAAIDRYAAEGQLNIWADSSAVSATRHSAEP